MIAGPYFVPRAELSGFECTIVENIIRRATIPLESDIEIRFWSKDEHYCSLGACQLGIANMLGQNGFFYKVADEPGCWYSLGKLNTEVLAENIATRLHLLPPLADK